MEYKNKIVALNNREMEVVTGGVGFAGEVAIAVVGTAFSVMLIKDLVDAHNYFCPIDTEHSAICQTFEILYEILGFSSFSLVPKIHKALDGKSKPHKN